MAGLPFTQLPAASPEATIQKEIQAGRQRIQDKFALKWQTVNANARYLGREKHQAMLRELHAKGKQEMLEFNQQAQQRLTQLQMIDQLAEAGGITQDKVGELKAGMVYGKDVARAMYPQQKSVPQQFAELYYHGQKLKNRLDYFKKEKAPKAPKASLLLGPLATPAVAAMTRYVAKMKRFKKEPAIEIWDTTVPGKEEWRKATEEERQEYMLLKKEQDRVENLKAKLLGQPDISRRLAQPGTKGGTFGDKIAESFKAPAVKRQQPASSDPLGLLD